MDYFSLVEIQPWIEVFSTERIDINKSFDFLIEKYIIKIKRKFKEGMKKFVVKEEDINKIMEGFKKGKNYREAWNKFLYIFSEKIYEFPKLYNKDKDFCGDYYVYVIEHLNNGKKLKSFDSKLSTFNTWFMVVLRNFFYEFSNKQNREWINTNASLDTYIDKDEKRTLLDIIIREDDSEPEDFKKVNKIKRAIEKLDIKLRVTVKLQFLFYYDYPEGIHLSELRYIQKESKRTFREVIIRLEQIKLKISRKYIKYKKEEEKLELYFYEKIKAKSKKNELIKKLEILTGLSSEYPSDKKAIKIIKKNILKLDDRITKKDKLINSILKKQYSGKYIVRTSKKDIAYILNIPVSTVGTRLHRVETILTEKLKSVL